MSKTREKQLTSYLALVENESIDNVNSYIKRYHKINRGFVLLRLSSLSKVRGLHAFFVQDNLNDLKQHFYVSSRLCMASHATGLDSNYGGLIANYETFLFGLLSDSPEILSWLSSENLLLKDDPKSHQFYLHMIQLLLQGDEAALRQRIEIGSKKAGKPYREQYASGTDFFSLVLKRDQQALEQHIENETKMKVSSDYSDFLAPYAVISAKLCWIKGIEVHIQHPLVPMPLLPVAPLAKYDPEYEFLQPGWEPPKPGIMSKLKSWLN